MKSNVSRRNMLKLAGGSAAGLLLTPVPWKTIDDLAIWTQNWPWVPTPTRGEVRYKYSICTMCPEGCGIRARCIGQLPVSIAGARTHPVNSGALCPAGFGGHHLAFHPLRVTRPLRKTGSAGNYKWEPTILDQTVAAIAGTLAELRNSRSRDSVAILDQRPGRGISLLYRSFLGSLSNGIYLTAPSPGSHVLSTLNQMLEEPGKKYGFDLAHAGTILSFGAPVMDGWGSPGLSARILDRRSPASASGKLKLIQVETRPSRTASLADRWIPVQPGTEAAFALGLAHVILSERLCDEESVRKLARDFDGNSGNSYRSLAEKFNPQYASAITGIAPEAIVDVAREIAGNAPVAAIAGGDPGSGPMGRNVEMAIWGLNFLLGSVGRKGGIVRRPEEPFSKEIQDGHLAQPTALAGIPDHSVRVLIMDAAESGSAFPWHMLAKKLVADKAVVISLSPLLTDLAERGDYIIPAPAHLEAYEDMPTAPASPAATYSISVPLIKTPSSAVEPMQFIRRLAAAAGTAPADANESKTYADLLKERVQMLYDSRRGKVSSAGGTQFTEMAQVGSAEDLWKLLAEGGCWLDGPEEKQDPPRFSFMGNRGDGLQSLLSAGEGKLPYQKGRKEAYPIVLMPYGYRGAGGCSQMTPLASKLHRESGLQDMPGWASINPETAKMYGLSDGSRAVLETETGKLAISIRFDSSVLPGVMHAIVGSRDGLAREAAREETCILSVCTLLDDTVWRLTPARITEAL